jgi:hypothetical protein
VSERPQLLHTVRGCAEFPVLSRGRVDRGAVGDLGLIDIGLTSASVWGRADVLLAPRVQACASRYRQSVTDQQRFVQWATADFESHGGRYRIRVQMDSGRPLEQRVMWVAGQLLSERLRDLLGKDCTDISLPQGLPNVGGPLSFLAPSNVFQSDAAELRRTVEAVFAEAVQTVKHEQERERIDGRAWLDTLRGKY